MTRYRVQFAPPAPTSYPTPEEALARARGLADRHGLHVIVIEVTDGVPQLHKECPVVAPTPADPRPAA